ncbi:hypothetical protein [Roseibium sp. RKSG952]|uniref:helix-turn-helix transcriptional regulator n=1 Tax=Roseibium sp. RKSG952 TaxID=2529384 RepID=UPI0012BC737C|nr:hypothetical protein [Roseibium sp. RKSG952]MTH99599.1 hypothetical protein [Roseibium sp. RKSG952]
MPDWKAVKQDVIGELFRNMTKRDAFTPAITQFAAAWPDIIMGWQVMNLRSVEWSHLRPLNVDKTFIGQFFEVAHIHPFPPLITEPEWHHDMLSSEQVISREDLANTEFYQHTFRRRGDCDRIWCMRAHEDRDNSALLSAHIPKHIGEREGQQFWNAVADFKPHLQSAFKLCLELHERASGLNGRDQFWLNQIPTPALVTDKSFKVLQMNTSAERLLARRHVLALDRNGYIGAKGRENALRLQKTVYSALASTRIAGPAGLACGADASLTIFAQSLGDNPDRPYEVEPFCQTHKRALVYVLDPHDVPIGPARVLEVFFGFTPAQARLLLELIGGLDLKDATEKIGIRLNTGRNHLAQMQSKSGLHKQAALVGKATAVLLRQPLNGSSETA